jgi:hypothetical protein
MYRQCVDGRGCWVWGVEFRGRILGRNPDKKCFSSLLFTVFSTQPLTVSTVCYYSLSKEKGGKPNRKPHPHPCGLRNPYRNLMYLKIMARNLKEIVRSGISASVETIFCRSLIPFNWPDSITTKLLDHSKGPRTDKHLPQSPFTEQFFCWRHFESCFYQSNLSTPIHIAHFGFAAVADEWRAVEPCEEKALAAITHL